MRTIVIAITALLIGTVSASARHHHYRHHAHRKIERHHMEKPHERVTSHNIRTTSTLETVKSTPTPKDIDPEALAFASPQEHFGDRPRKIIGKLVVGGLAFPFVSGGSGWSIPWGHWLVTPEEVGSWGARHGAIGLNNGDDIPDPKLHRGREGVEIHAAHHEATAGCVGILERYDELKHLVLRMIGEFGHAWLHVTPHAAAITPTKYIGSEIGAVTAADDGEPSHRHHRHRTRLARS